MNIDRAYIAPLYLLLSFSQVVRILNIVSSLSDWTPNGEFFSIHKSPRPSENKPPEYKPTKNAYELLQAQRLHS